MHNAVTGGFQPEFAAGRAAEEFALLEKLPTPNGFDAVTQLGTYIEVRPVGGRKIRRTSFNAVLKYGVTNFNRDIPFD